MLKRPPADVKPVLKYAGAKWRIADWISGFFPPHEIYLEPFFGSGAVFFRKAPARLETINDIDGNVVNLFRVLREQPEQLAALIELTPWARDEYYSSYEKTGEPVEDARRFLVRCWQAFGTMTAARTGWRHSATGRSPVMPQQWNRLPDMKSALGARRQPLILSISTAGYENDGIYDELMKRSTAFLKGNSKERRLLPFLYMIDDVEKWNDIEELKKANPNMGVSVFPDFFREEIAVAEMSASKKAEFLTKYCNIKQNSSIAWLDAHIVEGATAEITLEDFRHSYAVGGIDLSQTTDLTAATVIVERGGKLYAFTQFFMPANRVERATAIDGVPYDIFVKKGVVTLSGENYVDYKDVYNWFVMLKEKYEIYVLKVGYDRYSAQYLIDDMAAYGFHMDDVFQGENLAGVIREFEGILLDGNFKIPDNSLLKSHFLNVALKHNMETRKFRPVKIEQRARIDGFVSVIDAMTVRQKYYNEIGVMLKNAG